MLIGLTILAVGTSLPEIFITVTSAIDGHSDLIIGNAIGSCICNFLFVIGITSLVRPVKFDKRIVTRHLPIGMVAMLLLLFLGNTEKLRRSTNNHKRTRSHSTFMYSSIYYVFYL